MSNYHKPRTFRSLNGCCICRAKSSSSRFTDSEKYEMDFRECFKIEDERSGDICNACVLLVKRWKKLPRGSKKHWNHVVDARAGPGGFKGSLVRQKSKQGNGKEDPDLKFKKIVKKRKSSSASISYDVSAGSEVNNSNTPRTYTESPVASEDEESNHSSAVSNITEEEVSPFLDLNYWKRTRVCCGVVFIGPLNELMIDAKLYKPCLAHRKKKSSTTASLASHSSRSRTDTFSSNSSIPGQTPESPDPITTASEAIPAAAAGMEVTV